MTIKEQLLYVNKDVKNLDNRFTQFLDTILSIPFKGSYPQSLEFVLLMGTFNFTVQINGHDYPPYSDEFMELNLTNLDRNYVVRYSFLHNLCFNSFCTYFETQAAQLDRNIVGQYFKEYEFLLKAQLNEDNEVYQDSYKKYWREIILRIIGVFDSGQTSFYGRFNGPRRTEIINDLNHIERTLLR